jgi:predicted transposase YdaD
VNDIFKQRFDQKTVKKIERILEEKDPTEVKKMITNLERVIKREQDQRYNEGRQDGREEERKEREEERKETAINLYKMGLTIDQIAQGTRLDKEKLKEILKDVER